MVVVVHGALFVSVFFEVVCSMYDGSAICVCCCE